MKLVLLGLTGSGKSTVAPNLGKALRLKVLEIDDETTRLNGGTWPETEAVIDALFERIVRRVLDMDAILFVTSWLSAEEIAAFYGRDFVILELHAALEALVSRKEQRGDLLEDGRFYKNYHAYKTIVNEAAAKGMLRLSLDTPELVPAQVTQTVLTSLKAES